MRRIASKRARKGAVAVVALVGALVLGACSAPAPAENLAVQDADAVSYTHLGVVGSEPCPIETSAFIGTISQLTGTSPIQSTPLSFVSLMPGTPS